MFGGARECLPRCISVACEFGCVECVNLRSCIFWNEWFVSPTEVQIVCAVDRCRSSEMKSSFGGL